MTHLEHRRTRDLRLTMVFDFRVAFSDNIVAFFQNGRAACHYRHAAGRVLKIEPGWIVRHRPGSHRDDASDPHYRIEKLTGHDFLAHDGDSSGWRLCPAGYACVHKQRYTERKAALV